MKKSFPSSTIWLLRNLEGQDQLLILATYQWCLFCFGNIIMNIFYIWHVLRLCSHYLYLLMLKFSHFLSSWLFSCVLDLWFDSFFALWHKDLCSTLFIPDLESTTLPRCPSFFYWKWYLEIPICAIDMLIATELTGYLDLFSKNMYFCEKIWVYIDISRINIIL